MVLHSDLVITQLDEDLKCSKLDSLRSSRSETAHGAPPNRKKNYPSPTYKLIHSPPHHPTPNPPAFSGRTPPPTTSHPAAVPPSPTTFHPAAPTSPLPSGSRPSGGELLWPTFSPPCAAAHPALCAAARTDHQPALHLPQSGDIPQIQLSLTLLVRFTSPDPVAEATDRSIPSGSVDVSREKTTPFGARGGAAPPRRPWRRARPGAVPSSRCRLSPPVQCVGVGPRWPRVNCSGVARDWLPISKRIWRPQVAGGKALDRVEPLAVSSATGAARPCRCSAPRLPRSVQWFPLP
ncbi:proline-rich receptor-like protein kinase PERK2 [Triticum urartu]|uniref:proline-rich receptor-like protein kinase PERK2 n=1 Tax=Triticum urartu TaxID=4572 RepID=UPI002043E0D0|nr:proline-rich receptor-like protein kinase PERK2 [Triticum urartu]